MCRVLVLIAAQTVDEIVAHYIKTIGGMGKIQGGTTLRRSGKFTGGKISNRSGSTPREVSERELR